MNYKTKVFIYHCLVLFIFSTKLFCKIDDFQQLISELNSAKLDTLSKTIVKQKNADELNRNLISNIIEHNFNGVLQALSQGADSNYQTKEGQTPLHIAATSGKNFAIIKALLTHGGNVSTKDIQQKTPLYYAQKNDPSIFNLLVSFAIKDTTIKKSISPDISLFVADLKYSDTEIKFLDISTEKLLMPSTIHNAPKPRKIWKKVWDYLDSFNLPVWLICDKTFYKKNHDLYALNYFKNKSGYWLPDLPKLAQDNLFNKIAYNAKDIRKTIISDYSGIIMLEHKPISNNLLALFKKKFPQFLIINLSAKNFTTNKITQTRLFSSEKLKRYIPKRQILQKHYYPNLAKKLAATLGTNRFVIKPSCSIKGNGILAPHINNLDSTLKNILQKKHALRSINNNSFYNPPYPLARDYWNYDRNSHFIIENFISSKSINFEGKKYDPTLRIFFALKYDNQKIYLDIFEGFWLLPAKSINDSGNFEDKHMAMYSPYNPIPKTIPITKHKFSLIKGKLKNVLPDLYWNILMLSFLAS